MINENIISFLNENESTLNNEGEKINILDVACGNFKLSFEIYCSFTKKIKSIVGIDSCFDKDRIPVFIPCVSRFGERNIDKLFTINIDHENVPFEAGKTFFYIPMVEQIFLKHCECEFQFIVCSNFLHFFKLSEIRNYIKMMKKVLSKDGFIFFSIANENHSYSNDENKTVFEILELKNELEKEFEVVKIITSESQVLNYVLCKNKK